MQDGKTLPSGPVVISPDGLFPSLIREGKFLSSILLFQFLCTFFSWHQKLLFLFLKGPVMGEKTLL